MEHVVSLREYPREILVTDSPVAVAIADLLLDVKRRFVRGILHAHITNAYRTLANQTSFPEATSHTRVFHRSPITAQRPKADRVRASIRVLGLAASLEITLELSNRFRCGSLATVLQ